MGQQVLRSIYRKKTFTGLYIRYDSFCPRHHKLATIKSVASRAKWICTPSLLQDELDSLRLIFTENRFPINIINKCIEQAMEVKSVATEEDKTKNVFRLPYIGQKSSELGHRIKKQVAAAYPTVKTALSLTTMYAFQKFAKESLPTTTKSSVIYYYTCACEATHVGKTTQRLTERIKQHIPDKISKQRSEKNRLCYLSAFEK